MNDTPRNRILRVAFEAALDSATADLGNSGRHPVDDDELLLDWSLGDLDQQRREAFVDHLAECSSCRRELAAMVRAGAIVLPEVDEDDFDADANAGPSAAARHDQPKSRARPTLLLLAGALAASVLAMLAWGLFGPGGPGESSVIAMAQRDLDAGRAGEAFRRIDAYLTDQAEIAADQRARAEGILEASGYQVARQELTQGQFAKVSVIEDQVARRAGASARLVNLRLQAERGETAEQSLAAKTSLVADYGYERDGRRHIKDFTFPEITDSDRRLKKEFAEAVQAHLDSVELRLNFGQFLLAQNDFPAAADQFAEAVRIDPANALAQTGLGLALFQEGEEESIARALEHFRRAVELAPDDPAARLNLAVCLVRLGREAEAEPYFERGR